MSDDIMEPLVSRFAEGWDGYLRCDAGWTRILLDLNAKMSQIDPDYSLHQVKEKFGTLRFYYEPSSEDLRSQLDALVKEAEALSAITCEQTGQPGRLMRRGYVYKTLCDYYLDLGWEPALGEEKQ